MQKCNSGDGTKTKEEFHDQCTSPRTVQNLYSINERTSSGGHSMHLDVDAADRKNRSSHGHHVDKNELKFSSHLAGFASLGQKEVDTMVK